MKTGPRAGDGQITLGGLQCWDGKEPSPQQPGGHPGGSAICAGLPEGRESFNKGKETEAFRGEGRREQRSKTVTQDWWSEHKSGAIVLQTKTSRGNKQMRKQCI